MLSESLTKGARFTTFLILLAASIAFPSRSWGVAPAGVILGWDASTDPTVAGYNIYYGTSSRSYTNVISVGFATSVVITNLGTGATYYFAATTYTAEGVESDYSAEAVLALQPPNAQPTLDPLSDMTIGQDSGVAVMQLTGISSGAVNENQTLTVSAFSSNPGLISNPSVLYSSPDALGSLTFSPNPGSFGTAMITVMVDDGAQVNNTIIRSFVVTVVPPDNPPTIDTISDVVLNENSGPHNVNLTGISGPALNGNALITLTAVSDNPAVVPNPIISYLSPGSTGTLILNPVTNIFGSARITVGVKDAQPTNNWTSVGFAVTVNQAPSIPGLLTSAVVAPNSIFQYAISIPSLGNDKLSIGLNAGAPVGTKITTRKGVSWLVWTPTTAQASTTNLIGIKITDSTNPLLSTNVAVQVIVEDFVGLYVGSATIQAGQGGAVPIALASSEGVTNVSFAIAWPTNSLPNPNLSVSAAGVAASSLVNQITNLLVSLQMSSGQVLQGSNVIATLNFQSQQSLTSEYISLPVASMTATKPNALRYTNLMPTPGQVAVVNNFAMLQAATSASPNRSLTVLGKVGNTYQVQYATNFGPGTVWYPLVTFSQTNVSQTINLSSSSPQIFYRVQQK